VEACFSGKTPAGPSAALALMRESTWIRKPANSND